MSRTSFVDSAANRFDGRYPIYDAHGNRTATLVKSGASFSLTDVRTYDAWGNVRVGSQTGRPRARYCANLGHVQDDESGLIYMRARYYEPSSGRFVSEDPSAQGSNWYVYCRNNPVGRADPSGTLFMDLLTSALDNLVDTAQDGSVSAAAKKWGSDKISEAVAYQMGEIIGAFVAMELEEGGVSLNRLFARSDGVGFRWNNGDVFMHEADHGFGPHVDLRGALGKYESWFKNQFNCGAIPLDAFAEGFMNGFF